MTIWKISEDRPKVRHYVAPALLGRNYLCENGMSIHAGFSHNGSGPSAFGGADKWPTVRLEIPFCEGQEDRRDDFVDKLKAFIERELS